MVSNLRPQDSQNWGDNVFGNEEATNEDKLAATIASGDGEHSTP